jgi:putative peptidoglycan lipid II flippase
VLWAAQGLYARAFYAAGDTLTPMVAVTVITVLSLPIYSVLFHTFGVIGLAWASDIGIGINLAALAGLLHFRGLVSLGEMRWKELGKAAAAAIIAGAISFEVAKAVPLATVGRGSRVADVMQLVLVSITWMAAAMAGLWLMRSELPRDLRRRKAAAYPAVAQDESREILGAGR